MLLDTSLLHFLNDFAGRYPLFDAFIIFFASYAQYFLIAAFCLFLYFSVYPRGQKFSLFGVTVISVIVARLGVTELIRFFYHRPRPFLTNHLYQLISENEWSFPSGHAAFFFAMATAVYCYNKKWGAGFFAAALLITISRVIAGVHYPSDIFGGMIIGVVVAYAVFYFAEKRGMKE